MTITAADLTIGQTIAGEGTIIALSTDRGYEGEYLVVVETDDDFITYGEGDLVEVVA